MDPTRLSHDSEGAEALSQLTPTTEFAGRRVCRRIQHMLPKEIPLLTEHAVDPNFFKASHMVQLMSCDRPIETTNSEKTIRKQA